MTALILENIHHRFGPAEIVCDLSLAVNPGEVVCLLGPSGSGKTTVLRIAAGLESTQQGTVTIDGRTVGSATANVPPESRDVGLMFQDYTLFPHLTVAQNVEFGIAERPGPERAEIARKMLAQVGMSGFGEGFPYTLSGGEQQRVALARALAPNPRIMLMDEPFSGLDFRLRDQIRDDTLALLKEIGTATLLVTHDPEEAMLMSDRIALLNAGHLVQFGSPEDLYYRPKNSFVTEFFGEINDLDGVVENNEVATPFGPLPAPDLKNGDPARILIRPRGLRVHTMEAEGGVSAQVSQARLVGPDSLIDLVLAGTNIPLRARVPGNILPPTGSKVAVTLDQSRAFVFPLADD